MPAALNKFFKNLDQFDRALYKVKNEYANKSTSDELLNQEIINAQFTLDLMIHLNRRLIRLLSILNSSQHKETLVFLEELVKKYSDNSDKAMGEKINDLLKDLQDNYDEKLLPLMKDYASRIRTHQFMDALGYAFLALLLLAIPVGLALLTPAPLFITLPVYLIIMAVIVYITMPSENPKDNEVNEISAVDELKLELDILDSIPDYEENIYEGMYPTQLEPSSTPINKIFKTGTIGGLKQSFFKNEKLGAEVQEQYEQLNAII